MKRTLFITHFTPEAKRSLLRRKLNELYFRSLQEQTYSHWKVMILGDEERIDGKFNYFSLPDADRSEKMKLISELYEREEVKKLIAEAELIVKLDDDDIISPTILSRVSELDFDVYFDAHHTFCDISSDRITQQKRAWIASTCIHRKEHVFAPWNGEGASAVGNLLYTDHSKSWHLYYADKKKMIAEPMHPVYLRLLSPTSITSGAQKNTSHIEIGSDFQNYLSSFGNWKAAPTSDFEIFRNDIIHAWESGSGQRLRSVSEQGLLKKLFDRFRK